MLELHNVTKTYRKAGETIHAADDLSLGADKGELLVIHGPSGSGKSTLLLMAGGMLPPDTGTVSYGDEDVYAWSGIRRNRYRKQTVGFVFQRFFLVPYLTVFDNIRIPLALQSSQAKHADAVTAVAERLQIDKRLGHRPAELSVGEQQRAAVARALVGGQDLILADEPTGNLDARNVDIIADCLRTEAKQGRTILLVTHNMSLLDIGTRSLHLQDGRLGAS